MILYMIFGINTTRDISKIVSYDHFELSVVVFMPTTNNAITYTNF